ncbi:MAG: hypothetical protein QM817_13520 [Archangium sp.]
MADAPDILDLMGKTPREFGGLHVHFESVESIDGKLIVARLLVQAAFLPLKGEATVSFLVGSHELARHPLPVPRGTEAIRASYPLKLPAEVSSIDALIHPVPENGERIRPAWKLHDTHEIPKLSEMETYRRTDVAFDPAGSVLSSMLSGGIALEFNVAATELAAKTSTEVHRARELPARLTRELSGTCKPLGAIHFETVWMQGQPLPEPRRIVPQQHAAPKAGAIKRCGACAYEGPAAELERRTTCPACDALWG